MINRLTVYFSAIAALVVLALFSPMATAPEARPAAIFKNLSTEVISDYDKDPSKSLETVLLVDPPAQTQKAFIALLPKLTALGGQMFTGELNAAEVHSLDGLAGIALDRNRAATAIPVKEAKPLFQVPNLLWDAEVTVPQTDAELQAARTASGVDGSGVLVAVLDTGVDPEALGLGGGKVVHREDFTAPNSSCTDDGKLDPFGHGTHVASIIAGATDERDNSVQGVAPGAQILDLRVLDCAGSGNFDSIDQALQWILDNRATYPVKVINMSIGASDGQKDGLDPTSILINRVVASGIFVSVAAGNGYASANNLFMPATAEFGTTVASATVNKYGRFLSQFSSHGPTSDGRNGVDITAPGGGIRAALTTAKSSFNNYSVTMSGTSMATPYVAGLAALLVQKFPASVPSGTSCTVSADCPAGVDKATMTNGIQSLMKTSDWFEPGVDPHSGAGIVSASATLNGSTPAAAYTLTGTLDGSSDNVIQVPPHATDSSMQLLLDSSYRADMWDKASFTVQQVDSNYDRKNLTVVCTLLASTSCLFGEAGWTPRLFTYYLPASNETTTFVIRTSKVLGFRINIDSFGGNVNLAGGVSTTPLYLDGATSGTITLERTVSSGTSTSYTISPSGPLSAATSVTLPAGPAGTSVEVQVARSGAVTNSLERVVFTDPTGAMLASTVRVSTTGNGPLLYPNSFGYDDSDQGGPIFMAEDGSILGTSVATGLANSSSYGNPFRVAANSRLVTKYDITQTQSTQIDAVALSNDGTHAIFREFPAGSGIVPGDESLTWTYFVRNLNTGASFEVGPDWSQWANWYQAPYPPFAINEDGSAVAWAVAYPSGDKPVTLVMQSGASLATKTTLDSFAATAVVWVYAMSQGEVLVRVQDGAIDELRTYTGAGSYEVVPESNIQPMSAVYSANGSAIGFMNNNSDTMRCVVDGAVTTFDKPSQLGMSYPTQIRVANDCSWIVTTWDIAPGFPRGQHGLQLIRITSDGSVTRLDSTTGTDITWLSNLSATKFLRVTTNALEPGDINGVVDVYRGLGQSTETAVKLRALPTFDWQLASSTLAYASSMELKVTSPGNPSPVTFRVVYGQCHISDGKVFADAGAGGCQIEASTAENADFLANTATTWINFTKAARPANEITLQAPQSVEVGSRIAFTFLNPQSLPYNFNINGECNWANGELIATSLGTCRLVSVRGEDENYLETRIEVVVQVVKKNWTAAELALASIPDKYAGDSFDVVLTNGTGTQATLDAVGSCSIEGNRVTVTSFSSTCTVSAWVPETAEHAAATVTRVINVLSRQTVAGKITSTDWATGKVLPKGSTLLLNANATVVSGACSATGTALTATGSSGSCTFIIGGYSSGAISYSAQTVTIKLGPATQTWKTSLPTYTVKKLSTSKIVIPINGYATTSLGLKGTWSATSGCKVTVTSSGVTLDMGKLKKCVLTLKSPAGFRVPALTKTFTFTR